MRRATDPPAYPITVVLPAAMFAPNAYARARLLRRLHASGGARAAGVTRRMVAGTPADGAASASRSGSTRDPSGPTGVAS